jgi:pyruvate dehydrogenase E1 component
MDAERWNVLHPFDTPRESYVTTCLKNESGVFVIASDYVKALATSIDSWFPTHPVCLGTDGFGRSDGRRALRRFFEVNAEHIILATLTELAKQGTFPKESLKKAMVDLLVDPEKANPITS